MKLNQKGYMLVEIIISSVLAMGIAFYLLNLTYQFKNVNEDIYQSITYESDKIAITKNIMNDLNHLIVTNVSDIRQEDKTNIMIEFSVKSRNENGTDELRRLTIVKQDGRNMITYGKLKSDNTFDVQDVSYYQKILQPSLIVDTQKINVSTSGQYMQVVIPIRSMYEERDYDIKLLIKKGEDLVLNGSMEK